MLIFEVQGSGQRPYRVTAEGEATNFVMFCTCPAGKNGAKFCKHRRALLYGDVTKVTSGAEQVALLKEMARGSIHMHEANDRPLERLKHIPPQGVECVKSLATYGAQDFVDAGYEVEFEEGSDPWAWQAVYLYSYFKNGKRKKSPAFCIYWEEKTGDDVMQEDGSFAIENIRLRDRPFSVRGKGGKCLTTRKEFADAYDALREAAII